MYTKQKIKQGTSAEQNHKLPEMVENYEQVEGQIKSLEAKSNWQIMR